MTSLEDIFVWAGGSWMFREDWYDSIWKSDDFYVIDAGTDEHESFLEENL